jgi:predicted metal-binding membrane protein
MKTSTLLIITIVVSISVFTWLVSIWQYDAMMSSMMTFSSSPAALSLFVVIWTAGMAAMMFPAITPMVLLYDRLPKNNSDNNNEPSSTRKGEEKSSLIIGTEDSQEQQKMKSLVHFWSPYSLKMVLFIGSYLLVWALTGIAILVGWSITMNYILAGPFAITSQNSLNIIFGALLVISGLYQFSPLKTKCLGYCESPMSFFMRRWRRGLPSSQIHSY